MRKERRVVIFVLGVFSNIAQRLFGLILSNIRLRIAQKLFKIPTNLTTAAHTWCCSILQPMIQSCRTKEERIDKNYVNGKDSAISAV